MDRRKRNRGIYRYHLPTFMYRPVKYWSEWAIRHAKEEGRELAKRIGWE